MRPSSSLTLRAGPGPCIVASSTRVRLLLSLGPAGSHLMVSTGALRGARMEATDETVQLVERVAALDIGKATLMACIRVPHERAADRRRQEADEYATTTEALLPLADRLREPQRDPGRDGGHLRLLETGVLPPRGRRVRVLAAQRRAGEERARPAQDRQARRGVAGQGRRTRHVRTEFRATSADPPVAGPHPVSTLAHPRPHP